MNHGMNYAVHDGVPLKWHDPFPVSCSRPDGTSDAPKVRRRFCRLCNAALLGLSGYSSPVLAHVAEVADGHSMWTWWTLTPDVVLACIATFSIYVVGATRSQPRAARLLRHVGFVGGLTALFVALASPIDSMAERSFFVHQVQHLLLRMVGPLLLALSLPHASLVAGMPRALRRGMLAQLLANRNLRTALGCLGHPATATTLYVAALWIWQIPALHDRAVLDNPTHYLMHVSMLVAGINFWFTVFDPRAPRLGPAYGVRLVMIWLSILGNIVLGAWLTLKNNVYYHSYDALGRLWDLPAQTDERIGGLVIWIPGSMMSLTGVLVVIAWWGRRELRLETHATGPANARAELVANRELARRQALTLGGMALALFASAIVIGTLSMVSR